MLRLPTITVVAQKEPAPVDRVPASVTAVIGGSLDASRHRRGQRRGDLRAEHVLLGPVGAQDQQRAVSGHRVESVESRHHDVRRRRAAAEHQHGEHRAARCRTDRVRARRPECAVWPEHARRRRQRDEPPAVAVGLDGPGARCRSGATPSARPRRRSRGRSWPDRVGASFAWATASATGSRRTPSPGNSLDDRSAFAVEGPTVLQDGRALAGASRSSPASAIAMATTRWATWRPSARRRSRSARDFEGRTDRDLVSTTFVARREGRGSTLSSTTGIVNWSTFDETDLDYTPFPAVTRANTRRRVAVHSGGAVRVGGGAPRAPVERGHARLAGRRVLLHAGLRRRTRSTASRRMCSRRRCPSPSPITRRRRRSTTRASARSATRRSTFRERVDVSAGIRIDREHEAGRAEFLLRAGDLPGEHSRCREELLERVAAGRRSVPRAARTDRATDRSVVDSRPAASIPHRRPGSEAYGEEQAWHMEGGVKIVVRRAAASPSNAAVFAIDWADMQLNLPNPLVAGAVLHRECRRRRPAAASSWISPRA